MRVLVVEDETALAQQLTSALGAAGYVVDCAADGARADFLGMTELYDAFLLDLGLPKLDSLTLLRRWRDAGADDYVTKPFEMEEVLARVRALIRRAGGQAASIVRCGSVVLDARAARVTTEWQRRRTPGFA